MIFVRFWLPMTLLGSTLAGQPTLARETPPRAAEPLRSTASKIYGKWCSDCHSVANGPGSVALQRKYQGAVPAILSQRTDLTADYVRAVVRSGISFMPSFRKTEISDAELAALADYLAPAPGAKATSKKAAGSKRR
ncbi:c-type cytochrome [Sphingobium sp. HWE2-09]|uniref:c-type cytochrome n=1 Tax=Sphingobium sp. HWE2-09 TaxID=3108390 RepID=UPI002DC86370|nr:cytochrome c [Sphingobium sp. HWE2-09]